MSAVPANSMSTSTAGRPIGGRRTVALVTAAVACLIGLALALGGGALVVVDRTQRDSAGYVTSSGEDYATSTYAFTTRSLDVPMIGSGGLARGVLGKIRITSDSVRPVFVGIARAADVAAYLGSVNRAVLSNSYESRDAAERGAGAPETPPAAQSFWAASVAGAGQRSLDWKLRDSHWVAVLMNTNGSRGVAAHMRIGAEFPRLGWIGAGVLAAGLVLLAGGGVFLKRALDRGTESQASSIGSSPQA
jgi:hypothetical protein